MTSDDFWAERSTILDEVPLPPDGSDVGGSSRLDDAFDDMLSEHLEHTMPVPRLRLDAADVDDAGERLPKAEDKAERVVFPPLPPGAGIPDEMPRGARGDEVEVVTEEQLRIRAYLDSLPPKPKKTLGSMDPSDV
jgi:hypothetical protein